MFKGLLLSFFIFFSSQLSAQLVKRCASAEILQKKLAQNDDVQIRFEQELATFNTLLSERRQLTTLQGARVAKINYMIPVVFHIVMTNPSTISDQQIYVQLDMLNKAFAGTNADSARIPVYFRSLFGKSGIQFCLAQRTPEGLSTTGIHRVVTSRNSFSAFDNAVKATSLGGTDIWNSEQYLNIWICRISGDILGYSTIPGLEVDKKRWGIMADYRALPGSVLMGYNMGKTLIHEIGHYFNLYHIWGDDEGECAGTDYVGDTPNQGDHSDGCLSGIQYDNCTSSGTGIMYQNYLDYSSDQCMVMFTTEQVYRMEAAIPYYYPLLFTSAACDPVNANLTEKGFLITPNPAKGKFKIEFYPQPDNLKAIHIYSMTGQKIKDLQISQMPSTGYYIDVSSFAPGVYIVYAVFSNNTLQRKLIVVR